MKKFLIVAFLAFISVSGVWAQQKIVHTTDRSSVSANSSFMRADGLDGNRSAIIIVEYGTATRAANPHPVGVWFDGTRWAVFNEDLAPMQAGLEFNITWKSADGGAFWQRYTADKAGSGKMLIDNRALNGNPSAAFYVSQVWNPDSSTGVYNPSDITVEYDKANGKWAVKNLNGTPLPEGAAFNISIVGQSSFNSILRPAEIVNPILIKPNKGPIIPGNPALNADPGAIANAPRVTNLGFELGLGKWTPAGTAFANQPVEGNTVSSERVLLNMQYGNGGIGGDYWKGMAYPIGIKENNWIGTFEKGNGDGPTGTLTSDSFRVTGRYLNFLLGGGSDVNKLYVELQVRKDDYETVWGAGNRLSYGVTDDGYIRVRRITSLVNAEDLYRYWFDLDNELNHQFAGKTVRVVIADNSSRSLWGHINVDDFRQSETVGDFLRVNRDGFSLYADKDKPVWGFADTHAHWMNHIGLGGLMHGVPGGNWKTSDVRRDIPPCDGFNHNLPTITPGLLIPQTEKAAFNRAAERMAEPSNLICAAFAVPTLLAAAPVSLTAAAAGAPDVAIENFFELSFFNPAFANCGYAFTKNVFAKHYNNSVPDATIGNYVDYPRWNTFFHQTMHISWVRRSYDGGQRLMVVPVGTAKSWEFISTADGNMQPAKTHIENAVRALKTLVDLNSEWMEIAYTPEKAREIILSNKMAIVIGLEQGEIGSYFESVADEINWLDSLGIRHVFPIHNIDNKLGGAAVFKATLNSYNDLVNRRSLDDPPVGFRLRASETRPNVTYTSFPMERTFLRQGMRNIPINGFGEIPFFFIKDVPNDAGYGSEGYQGRKNAAGLSDKGREYIDSLMKKGMIIEVDHMSDLSQDEAMRMFGRYGYPMISGHSNFRELRAAYGHPTDNEDRQRTEFTIHDRRVDEINNAGGMFGIMTQQNDIESVPGNPVRNNAAGGTPSFAQAYWYALQKTNGERGIAFGSDFNGFAPQIAPRFGVDAAAVIEGDAFRNASTDGTLAIGGGSVNTPRRTQAFAQKNGVKYDKPINTYHYHRFLKPSFLSSEEREIWEAIAIAKSGVQPSAAWQPGGGISVERTFLQQNKIRNLAEGFVLKIPNEPPRAEDLQFLDCPDYGIGKGDCPAERKAAFMAVHGANSLPQNLKDDRTTELYLTVRPIYNLWMQFENGPNEPLRRSFAFAGGRDFDYNLDGLAHYGMYPDLIQDMKNLGLAPAQLRPLFVGAEQYILMWELAERAKAAIGN
ncbi:hypothetical protein BH10ACI3_BH10ACI3_10380 [soil metagenome]